MFSEQLISRNIGGKVSACGCSIGFSPNSLRRDYTVKITVESQSVIDDSANGITISPKLGCNLDRNAVMPGAEVDVEILSYCFAQRPVEIAVMSQEENSDNWFVEKRLMLGRDRSVKFKTSHFSKKFLKFIRNIGMAWLIQKIGFGDYLKFPIEPYLFYNECGIFKAYACIDDKAIKDDLEIKHEKAGFESKLVAPEVVIAKYPENENMFIELKCVHPGGVTLTRNGRFDFTSDELLDKDYVEGDFEFENFPEDVRRATIHLTFDKIPSEGNVRPRIVRVSPPTNSVILRKGQRDLESGKRGGCSQQSCTEKPTGCNTGATNSANQRFELSVGRAKNVYVGGQGEYIDNRQSNMEHSSHRLATEE